MEEQKTEPKDYGQDIQDIKETLQGVTAALQPKEEEPDYYSMTEEEKLKMFRESVLKDINPEESRMRMDRIEARQNADRFAAKLVDEAGAGTDKWVKELLYQIAESNPAALTGELKPEVADHIITYAVGKKARQPKNDQDGEGDIKSTLNATSDDQIAKAYEEYSGRKATKADIDRLRPYFTEQ